jgi:hypothetical protein
MKGIRFNARFSGEMGILRASPILAAFGVLVSCNGHVGQRAVPDKPVAAYTQNGNGAPGLIIARHTGAVPWGSGECQVMRDRIVYTQRTWIREDGWRTGPRFVNVPFSAGSMKRGEVNPGMQMVGPDERILEVLPGWKRTVVLTTKNLIFTSGAEYAFAKMEPSLLNPVPTRDFSLVRYDVEEIVGHGLLGWTVGERNEGFFLMGNGMIEVRGANHGNDRLSYPIGIPLSKKAALRFFEGNLLIAHPGTRFIVLIENAATMPFMVHLRLGEPLSDRLKFEERDGFLVLENGEKKIVIKKNGEGKLNLE